MNSTFPPAHSGASGLTATGATSLPSSPADPGGVCVELPAHQELPPGQLLFAAARRAFRVGGISTEVWNRQRIGTFSFACGLNTSASGEGSFAAGVAGTAGGHYAVALGLETVANGSFAVATGAYNQATGAGSFAAGSHNAAQGRYAAAFGRGTVAASFAEFVVGSHNTRVADASADRPRPTDRALVVGIGRDEATPADGFVVYKDGSLGLHPATQPPADPTNRLYVLNGELHFNHRVLGSSAPLPAPTPPAPTPPLPAPPDGKSALTWQLDAARQTITLPTAAHRGANVEVSLTANGGFVDSRLLLHNQQQALRFGSFNEADQSRPVGKGSVGLGDYATASGRASFAAGADTWAKGNYATALGRNAEATGENSFAAGATHDYRQPSQARGAASVALAGGRADGQEAVALTGGSAKGENALAAGYASIAAGNYAVALGCYATAPSYGEVVVGTYNTDYTPKSPLKGEEYDRAFCVGTGTPYTKKDALVVFKNGRVLVNNQAAATGEHTIVKGLQPAQLQLTSDSDGVTILNNPYQNSLNIVKRYSLGPTGTPRFISFGYQQKDGGDYVEVGSIQANGGESIRLYESSDARLKNDLGLLSGGLATLSQIKVHRFTWKSDGQPDMGVFAQELHAVFPAAVQPGDTGPEVQQRWMVDYGKLQPLTVAAVQELHQTVLRQQQQIEELQQQVKALLSRW